MRKFLLGLARFLGYFQYKNFIRNLNNPKDTQEKTLEEILRLSNSSEYLEKYDNITCLKDFQKALPVSPFNHFENLTLTNESPIFHETTSGSSGKQKRIPYTKSLIQSFSKMFLLWVYDFLTYGPRLSTGIIYFSISPQFGHQEAQAKDDTDYLNGPISKLINYFSLVPTKIKDVRNEKEFYHILSLYFLASDKLEVISVWSPTYLLRILDYIDNNFSKLKNDLKYSEYQYGSISFSLPVLSPNKKSILKNDKIEYRDLFPNLKIVSCWGGSLSHHFIKKLESKLPFVNIQPKGLMATEAPMTFPSFHANGFLPLINECFFEFMNDQGHIKLIHELQQNETYEIIVSQKSGLLRYIMGDLIKVTHFFKKTPCFEFVGRADQVSDMVGEKLSEEICREAFKAIAYKGPKYVIPVINSEERPYYLICTSRPCDIQAIQQELMKAFHYKNAISLAQLSPVKALVHKNIDQVIEDYFIQQKGMNLGDIKTSLLLKNETSGMLVKWIREKARTL